jgi:diguanylate cyclase (GGDEF)-like protein
MPNAPHQPMKLAATLVLEDAMRLSGELSLLLDGRLQLDGVRPEASQDLHRPINLAKGRMVTLFMRESAAGQPLEAAKMKISRLFQDSITLEFEAGDTAIAARYRELISGGFSPGFGLGAAANQRAAARPIATGPQVAPAARPTTAASQAAPPAPPLAAQTHAEPTTAPASAPDSARRVRRLHTGVTAQYAALLETLEQQGLEELHHAISPFLYDLAEYLQTLASSVKPVPGSTNYYREAANTLQRRARQVTDRIVQQISDFFRDLTPQQGDDHLWQYQFGSSTELDLIDLKEFDDFLAIDRMVTLGEDLHNLPLEALTVRVATLIDVDPNIVRLPIHVRQLCRAFQRALAEENIPQNALTHIYDYFAKQFISQLGGYYDPLNKLLADSNVLPDVELEITTKGTLLKRNQLARPAQQRRKRTSSEPLTPEELAAQREAIAPISTAIAELNQIHRQIGEQLGSTFHHSNPADLYRSVVDALNFKREAEGLADSQTLARGIALSGTWDGATVASTDLDQSRLADAQSIARALSALQRSSQVRDAVQRSDSLRAYLASNRDQIGGLKNSSGLTADSLNQLDMVDNLFGTIKSQLDVSSDLKPALGNLQIPLAKLALLDPRFFVDHTHTARTVVDKLSRLAASANFPNKALEGRINDLVDDIVRDYESDDSVFATALEKIEKLSAQQQRALARNIERVVRTQEGQQKLADARREVGKVISDRIKPPMAPKVLQDLVDNGWRDLLVLTHVKSGTDSSAWADQIRTLDLLCLWLDERSHNEGGDDLRVQRSLEAEPLIDLIGQQIATAIPTNVTHEEVLEQLRDILAGNTEVESAPVGPQPENFAPEPAEIRAKIEDLPRLRRWVKRVEQLEPNCWLTYRDKSGQKKRMQLAWTSANRDRYIFVNERGQKVADLTSIQLARQLSRGVQPPAMADRLSVVDQSMYHTLEHVQKSLSFARNHDSLTRLINRDTFINQLQRALRHSQLKHSQHAVLYLNIDQFKLVNEVYDRISGDQVLLEFAKLLAQLHGKKSSSARMQADEFAILLLDRSLDQAVQIAERIRRDIEASSMDIEGENVSFTVSIGVAAILDYSPTVDDVLEASRSAMRHAKQRGRNQVVRFEEDQSKIEDYKLEKTRKRRDLESALASERFILRAQPIVQTAVADRTNSTLHYELLLGLVNKDGSLSSPEEFIQSAERYGFMTLVDRWVVREAFTWISKLMDEQKVVPNLAINLSGASVTDDSFMEYLLEQISEFGVGTSRLCFEITETGTISNLVKAADFVRAFRNIGCKFSIDDFGTGLASHNYLRELPVDYVKIDGSFITGVDKNRNDYAMARSINDLAHFLGQETIAESVESDEIIVKLEEMGVDYLQGWGIARPKPLIEVTSDLSNLEK